MNDINRMQHRRQRRRRAGLTGERVRQLENQALAELRQILERETSERPNTRDETEEGDIEEPENAIVGRRGPKRATLLEPVDETGLWTASRLTA